MDVPPDTPARPLQGCAAVVVGGPGALTAAVARRLLADGAGVLATALDDEAAVELESALSVEGGAAYAVVADPARARDVDAAFGEALRVFGGVDVAVAVAAPAQPVTGGAFTLEDAAFERSLLATLRPAFAALQRAVRLMAGRGRGGSIVLVVDLPAPGDARAGLAGDVAGAALETLTRGMAAESGGRGVRVNLVRTALAGGAAAPPLGVPATAEDVAAAVAFLASARASYVSGVVLPVDGGRESLR